MRFQLSQPPPPSKPTRKPLLAGGGSTIAHKPLLGGGELTPDAVDALTTIYDECRGPNQSMSFNDIRMLLKFFDCNEQELDIYVRSLCMVLTYTDNLLSLEGFLSWYEELTLFREDLVRTDLLDFGFGIDFQRRGFVVQRLFDKETKGFYLTVANNGQNESGDETILPPPPWKGAPSRKSIDDLSSQPFSRSALQNNADAMINTINYKDMEIHKLKSAYGQPKSDQKQKELELHKSKTACGMMKSERNKMVVDLKRLKDTTNKKIKLLELELQRRRTADGVFRREKDKLAVRSKIDQCEIQSLSKKQAQTQQIAAELSKESDNAVLYFTAEREEMNAELDEKKMELKELKISKFRDTLEIKILKDELLHKSIIKKHVAISQPDNLQTLESKSIAFKKLRGTEKNGGGPRAVNSAYQTKIEIKRFREFKRVGVSSKEAMLIAKEVAEEVVKEVVEDALALDVGGVYIKVPDSIERGDSDSSADDW